MATFIEGTEVAATSQKPADRSPYCTINGEYPTEGCDDLKNYNKAIQNSNFEMKINYIHLCFLIYIGEFDSNIQI